jgi:CRP-like cAMP-binding protein/RsiW-degrading membrane proteinase PrsW (M82 family)
VQRSVPERGLHLEDLYEDRGALSDTVALSSTYLFGGLPEPEFAAVSAVVTTEHWSAGVEVVREGEAGDACYVIASGNADVVTHDLVGQEVVLQRMTAGASFGAVALATGAPRSATVRATSDVEALVLTREAYERIKPSCPTLAARLVEYVDFLDVDRFLKRASPFVGLPPETVRAIVPRLGRQRVTAGATVVREGDEADLFYLIRSGTLVVTERGKRPRELGPGECFGEVALLTGGKRAATVTAKTDADLLTLDKATFDDVAAQNDRLRGRLSELARIRVPGISLSVPDPVTALVPFVAGGARRYRIILIAGVALFAVASILAARSGNEFAIYLALVLGAFVVPVAFVTYLAESDVLAAHPIRLALTFVLGAAIGIPVAIQLELATGAAPGALDTALLVGIIEEFAKVLGVVWLLGRSSARFRMDGVVYGAAAGMGFAAFETILYGQARLDTPGTLLATLWMRTLLAPFGHGTWTAIVCASLWRAKGQRAIRVDRRLFAAFAIAVGLHALWDWQPLPGLLGLLWYLAIGFTGIRVLGWTVAQATREELGSVLALDPDLAEAHAQGRAVSCGRCGQVAPIGARYCARCGGLLRASRSEGLAPS